MTTDELGEGICLRAGRIVAAEAEMLPWIAEFDRREGWAGTGLLSCAHWLSWKVGLSLGAAREQVRVARRLEDLPEVAAAYGAGRVSYSKVRAITRVAEPEDGIDWVAHARCSTAAQLENLVRGVRRARFAELQRQRDAATVETDVEAEDVPAEAPALEPVGLDEQAPGWPSGTTGRDVRKATDSFFANLARWSEPVPDLDVDLSTPEARAARRAGDTTALLPDVPAGTPRQAGRVTDAEALLALAQDALAVEQAIHPSIARRRRPQLTAQVDPLSGWGRQADGELLPPTSLRAVMKTLPGRDGLVRLRPVTEADLRRHDLGRTARDAHAPLRELLGTLDGERCRFPGCTRRKKLHAHHVRYWSDGGSTDLDNLVKSEYVPWRAYEARWRSSASLASSERDLPSARARSWAWIATASGTRNCTRGEWVDPDVSDFLPGIRLRRRASASVSLANCSAPASVRRRPLTVTTSSSRSTSSMLSPARIT